MLEPTVCIVGRCRAASALTTNNGVMMSIKLSSTLGMVLLAVCCLALSFAPVPQGGTTTAGTCYMLKSFSNGYEMPECSKNANSECGERECQPDGNAEWWWCDCHTDGQFDDCRCDGIVTLNGGGYPIIVCAGACWVCGTGVEKCQSSWIPYGQTVPACNCGGG